MAIEFVFFCFFIVDMELKLPSNTMNIMIGIVIILMMNVFS